MKGRKGYRSIERSWFGREIPTVDELEESGKVVGEDLDDLANKAAIHHLASVRLIHREVNEELEMIKEFPSVL